MTAPMVRVRIVHRRTGAELAIVPAHRQSVPGWGRVAKADAITTWRRQTKDYRTPIRAELA